MDYVSSDFEQPREPRHSVSYWNLLLGSKLIFTIIIYVLGLQKSLFTLFGLNQIYKLENRTFASHIHMHKKIKYPCKRNHLSSTKRGFTGWGLRGFGLLVKGFLGKPAAAPCIDLWAEIGLISLSLIKAHTVLLWQEHSLAGALCSALAEPGK